MNTKLTTAQYLALIDQIGYAPASAAPSVSASRRGMLGPASPCTGRRCGRASFCGRGSPLFEGKIVACACGASYNDASATMTRLHAGH